MLTCLVATPTYLMAASGSAGDGGHCAGGLALDAGKQSPRPDEFRSQDCEANWDDHKGGTWQYQEGHAEEQHCTADTEDDHPPGLP